MTKNLSHAKALAFKIKVDLDNVLLAYRMGFLALDELEKRLSELKIIQSKNHEIAGHLITIEEAFERYKEEKIKSHSWSPQNVRESMRFINVFIEFVGKNTELRKVTHQTLLDYRSLLQKLPNNRSRNYSKIPLAVLAEQTHEQLLSNKTINSYLQLVQSLFSWAHRHELTETMPAHNLKVGQAVSSSKQREAFSVEQINIIKARLDDMRDRNSIEDFRYWSLLIAIYSGLRLSELAQLHVNDTRAVNEVPVFDINPYGTPTHPKKVKTPSSERIVPIHSELLKRGFMQFVQQQKQKGEVRLFSCLKYNPKTQDYGRAISKWFNVNFKKKCFADSSKLVFHSFRHTLATELKNLLLPTEVISEILGHSVYNISTGRYGKRYKPAILLAALERLPY
jgi:integrase